MTGARAIALMLLGMCACTSPPAGETGSSSTGSGTSSGSSGTDSTGETPTTGEPAGWEIGLQLGQDRGALLSVWGPAADEVYAVGGQLIGPAESHGVMYQFDGASWSPLPLPDDTPMLHWIYGVDGELWTVGREGAALRRDGDEWVAEPTGVATILWGIWGAHKDELWTVGGDGVDDEPVMLRWDGATWSPVTLPPMLDSGGLFKVWGSAVDDVTAVGDRGLALHHDGVAWTLQPTNDLADLISVWGRGPGEHLAVGGRANGRVARWDGAAWTGETFEVPGLSGVWMAASGAATVVGMQGTIAELGPGSLTLAPQESPTLLLLHAVFGFEDGTRFAVGGSLAGPPPYVGVIVQHRS